MWDIFPYCFRRVSPTSPSLGTPRANPNIFWDGLCWQSIPRWHLEKNLFPPYVSLPQTAWREKEKIVHFLFQAITKLSSRGRQSASWLHVGIASYFWRTIAPILCKWRLALKSVLLMLTWAWRLIITFSKTSHLTCMGKSCQNLLYSRHCEICIYFFEQNW